MLLITNKKLYDALKQVAMVVLPALGTLYFAFAQVWGLGHGDQVVGTIVALDTFLGVVLHISSTAFSKSDAKYDGTVDITETADKKSYSLNLNTDPDELDAKDEITFKVNPVKKVTKRAPSKRVAK
jgi:hypothetical protein